MPIAVEWGNLHYGKEAAIWAFLPSWQLLILVIILTLITCYLRGLVIKNCFSPDGTWIAVSGEVDDTDDGMTEQDRLRAISLRYWDLRREGRAPQDAMTLAESAFAPKRRNKVPRKHKSTAISDDVDANKVVDAEPVHFTQVENNAATPNIDENYKRRLVAAEKKLKRYQRLIKVARVDQIMLIAIKSVFQSLLLAFQEGYDDIQARFLAGLPREVEDDDHAWIEVQDHTTGADYFWDGGTRFERFRPVEVIWHCIVIFVAPPVDVEAGCSEVDEGGRDGGGEGTRAEAAKLAATRFEFCGGDWVAHSPCELPPKPLTSPRMSLKTAQQVNGVPVFLCLIPTTTKVTQASCARGHRSGNTREDHGEPGESPHHDGGDGIGQIKEPVQVPKGSRGAARSRARPDRR
jgi:hypothetical protein